MSEFTQNNWCVRAALYGSSATAVQAGAALEQQFADGQKLVCGMALVETARFGDEGLSDLRLRPGLIQALAAALDGKFDVLVVRDLSRLSRNSALLYEIVRLLNGAGVRIAPPDGGVLCRTCAAGRLH